MGVHRGVMHLQHSTPQLCRSTVHVQLLVWHAQRGQAGLNTPCYRLHLSALCCLPALDFCQVQGGGKKTVMHCLPPYFNSPPAWDTGEICLAAPVTILSSNQPVTAMATIVTSLLFPLCFNFWCMILAFFASKFSPYCFHEAKNEASVVVAQQYDDGEGDKPPMANWWTSVGLFYLFSRWPRSAWWGW